MRRRSLMVDAGIKYEFVDLGLPSGTLWCTKNIGAKKITDYGLYFAFAENVGYEKKQIGVVKNFSWADYKWSKTGSGTSADMAKYNDTDKISVITAEDDAAVAYVGDNWCTPNKTAWNEILNNSNCTKQWITNYLGTNVNGCLFTSLSNGNTMFLPASGFALNGRLQQQNGVTHYFTSTVGVKNVKQIARSVIISSSMIKMLDYTRQEGNAIRPIINTNV